MTPGNTPVWTRFAPEHLKPLGYRCYHSGKWHIRFLPLAGAGFDHSYCLLDQNRFFTPAAHLLDDEPLARPKESDGFYATTAIAAHAVNWLKGHARDHRADPFFLYLAFTAPHFPLQAMQEDIERYRGVFDEGWDAIRERRWRRMRRMGLVNCDLAPLEPDMWTRWNTPDEELLQKIGPGEVTRAVPWASLTAAQKSFQRIKMAIHAAMISRMDREIGRVIDQLKAMNAFENTVILFLSDNGASSEQLIRADGHDASARPGSARSHLCLGPGWSSAANAPFRLHKSWVHEGGISSPLIVHWPAGIKDRGQLRNDPCHLVDVVPTLVDLAGGDPGLRERSDIPPVAGKTLAPAFTNGGRVHHDFLYFNHANNRALRAGNWKLVAAGATGPWELYDMRTDRCERRNLVSAEAGRAAELAATWKKHDEECVRQRESAPPTGKPRLGRARGKA